MGDEEVGSECRLSLAVNRDEHDKTECLMGSGEEVEEVGGKNSL